MMIKKLTIVDIDDALVFSKSIFEDFKHVQKFFNIIKSNKLVVSAPKMKLCQTKIRFLEFDFLRGTFTPINRSLEFADKFPNEIKDKTQLQMFLGCLNYVSDFIPHLQVIYAFLYKRLRKNPLPWSDEMTKVIQTLKKGIKCLPCLGIPYPNAFLIIETNASDVGYRGILKQRVNDKDQLVKYHSGFWIGPQVNYSTIKKEVLSIELYVTSFQDVFNKKFLLRTYCKSTKFVLGKNVKNLVSKQISARWQAILSNFDFDIEHIKIE